MYAIVISQGRYSSNQLVRAARVCRDVHTALKLAHLWTRTHRESMYAYGGTSGGYRVVEVVCRRNALWFGYELDRLPSII